MFWELCKNRHLLERIEPCKILNAEDLIYTHMYQSLKRSSTYNLCHDHLLIKIHAHARAGPQEKWQFQFSQSLSEKHS